MPRRVRFIPEDGALVEVSCRTVQSRYLLRPGPVLNEIVLGVLGRAQRLYPVAISGFVFLSNHYQALGGVRQVCGSVPGSFRSSGTETG